MPDKSVIRKGSPFKATAVESMILKGMVDIRSMHRDDNKFYASDAAACPRRAVKFLHTDRKDSITPSSIAYMTVGSAMHEMVSDALFKTNKLIFKEYKLPPRTDPDVRGMVDNIIFGPEDKILGIEVKTCGNLPGKPKVEHELQALTYAALTGLDFAIVYISRKVAGYDGKLMIKSFDIECDDETLISTLTHVCLAHYANEEAVLPPIPPTFSKDKDCRFCAFSDECWEGAKEVFETAGHDQLDDLYEKAEARAEEIVMGREIAKKGVLKHIERYAAPDIQRRLASVAWS